MYQTTKNCTGSGASEERSDRCLSAAFYGNTREVAYSDYIPIYTDGSRDGYSVACATVVPPNTVIPMITAEVWAIIKALEQVVDSIASI